MLHENAINFKYSPRIFANSVLWLQAKPLLGEDNTVKQYQYDNDFALIYHNKDSFIKGYSDGSLHTDMMLVKKYRASKKAQGSDFKVIIVFHSVHDSLYNAEHSAVTKAEYDKFLIDLTISYEFDYVQLDHTVDVIDFLKEMHTSVQDKPHRKELSMYSRKGFKPGKKAQLSGFKDSLSVTYISFLMCIPGVSENKAIGLARVYPTLQSLMELFLDPKATEKEKLNHLQGIEVSTSLGDKNKKLGKALAERIFRMLMSVNPSIQIN